MSGGPAHVEGAQTHAVQQGLEITRPLRLRLGMGAVNAVRKDNRAQNGVAHNIDFAPVAQKARHALPEPSSHAAGGVGTEGGADVVEIIDPDHKTMLVLRQDRPSRCR